MWGLKVPLCDCENGWERIGKKKTRYKVCVYVSGCIHECLFVCECVCVCACVCVCKCVCEYKLIDSFIDKIALKATVSFISSKIIFRMSANLTKSEEIKYKRGESGRPILFHPILAASVCLSVSFSNFDAADKASITDIRFTVVRISGALRWTVTNSGAYLPRTPPAMRETLKWALLYIAEKFIWLLMFK